MTQIPNNFINKVLVTSSITTGYTGNVTLNNVTDIDAGTVSNPQAGIFVDSVDDPTKWEIVHFTTVNPGTNEINIIARGQENTSAQEWQAGAFFYQGLTNEMLQDIVDDAAAAHSSVVTVSARLGTGSQAITGAGFTPSLVRITATHITLPQTDVSNGITDGTTTISTIFDGSFWGTALGSMVFLNGDIASLTSIDVDGCTINWTTRSVQLITLVVEFYR